MPAEPSTEGLDGLKRVLEEMLDRHSIEFRHYADQILYDVTKVAQSDRRIALDLAHLAIEQARKTRQALDALSDYPLIRRIK